MNRINKEYLQSAMFGFNDALVSTTGVIVGISTGTSNKQVVILAGVVTILVEALSMGSGQYLSSKSAHQLDKSESFRVPVIGGLVMFGAYFLAGLVPLLSIIFAPMSYSRYVAIVAALTCLLALVHPPGQFSWVPPVSKIHDQGATTVLKLTPETLQLSHFKPETNRPGGYVTRVV